MSVMSRFAPFVAPFTAPMVARWSALNDRQRRLAGIGSAALLLGLFVAFVWLPLDRAQRSLSDRLPALRAQHAILQRDAEDVRRLKALSPTATAAPNRQPDANSLRTVFAGADVTAIGSGRYRVVLADGRFARWLDALRALNGQLVVAELSARRDGDKLRIEAVLAPPKAGR